MPRQQDEDPDHVDQDYDDQRQALEQLQRAGSRGDEHTHVVITGAADGIAQRTHRLTIALLRSGHATIDTAIVDGTAVLTVQTTTPEQRRSRDNS